MTKSDVVQARIDTATKLEAQNIVDNLGMTLSQAISIFLKQVVIQRRIPFEIKLPNKVTEETIKNLEEGKDLHRVSSVDELFKDLNA